MMIDVSLLISLAVFCFAIGSIVGWGAATKRGIRDLEGAMVFHAALYASFVKMWKQRERALVVALRDLLEDTQHAGHDCGFPKEYPVFRARALLTELDK